MSHAVKQAEARQLAYTVTRGQKPVVAFRKTNTLEVMAYRHDDGVKTVRDVIQVARAPHLNLNDYPGPQNLYEIASVPGKAKSAARVKSDV